MTREELAKAREAERLSRVRKPCAPEAHDWARCLTMAAMDECVFCGTTRESERPGWRPKRRR